MVYVCNIYYKVCNEFSFFSCSLNSTPHSADENDCISYRTIQKRYANSTENIFENRY